MAADAGSIFCPNCGRHAGLVTTDRPGVVVVVEYAEDGYTATAVRHVCGGEQ